MTQTQTRLAWITLLSSASLFAGSAAAEDETTRPATSTAPSTQVYRTSGSATGPSAAQAVEPSVPTTPMAMNLPDEATDQELEGERGIGLAELIIGSAIIAGLLGGALYVVSRRSWSTSH